MMAACCSVGCYLLWVVAMMLICRLLLLLLLRMILPLLW